MNMLEATVTLKSGKIVGIVAEDFPELARQMDRLDYKEAKIKRLEDASALRQGKYAGGDFR